MHTSPPPLFSLLSSPLPLLTHSFCKTYYCLAIMLHRNKKNIARVRELSKRAVELDPNMYKAHFMLALTYIDDGDDREQQILFEKALQLALKDGSPVCTLFSSLSFLLFKTNLPSSSSSSTHRVRSWNRCFLM
jgi:tetratricopeptide (TPR) repeat protein